MIIWRTLVLAAALLAVPTSTPALLSCAGPPAAAPNRDFAAYEGRLAALFDDAIEASAVGLNLDQRPPLRGDTVLRERAHLSDGVVKLRVKTVTSKIEGPESAYLMELEPFVRLGGKRATSSSFVVRFDKASPAFGIVKSMEGRLVGKTFVGFVRQFSPPGADATYHVHLAADAPDVEAAVKEAMALDELR